MLALLLAAASAVNAIVINNRDMSTSPDLTSRALGLDRRATTSCGTSGQTSCHNTTAQSNLCCFEAPGGLLTQVQFWDTDPVTGPVNSWTIHGLWPDNCDGTYSENCDSSRDYTDIGTILKNAGRTDLFNYMTDYMQSNDGTPESFWEHEWNTHGTCYSTLQTKCLPSGSAKGTDAVDFFSTLVGLFQELPTYTWLANAGITPGTKTYTLSQIQAAIKAGWGYTPAVDCSSSEMYQIYYYFNLKGSMIDGEFVPINAPSAGSCGSSGIKYLTKSGATTAPSSTATTKASSTTKTSTGATTTTTGTGGGSGTIPSKGYLRASSGTGCILTAGTWSTQTCATITFSGTSSALTVSTSKGNCGVSSGVFTCGSGVTASTFGAVASGSNTLLTYGGSALFSSTGTPSGTTVETVYTGSSKSVQLQLVISSS